jgi:hypothetical protein
MRLLVGPRVAGAAAASRPAMAARRSGWHGSAPVASIGSPTSRGEGWPSQLHGGRVYGAKVGAYARSLRVVCRVEVLNYGWTIKPRCS